MGKKKKIWVILSTVVVLLLVAFFFRYLGDEDIYDDAIFLKEDWSVQINDSHFQNVDLEHFSFKTTSRGDVVVYSRKLPDAKIDAPCLRIYTSHCTAEVYIDDECVYSFGIEDSKNGKMIGGGYHWLPLNENFQNKELKIRYVVQERKAFASIVPPVLQTGSHAIADFLKEYRLSIYVGVFLIIFGCGCFVVSIILLQFQKAEYNLLWISIFSFCVGLWTVCNTDVIIVLTKNYYKIDVLEYLCLYIGMIPMVLFYWGVKKDYQELKRGFIIITVANILLPIVAITAHVLNIAHLCAFVPVFQCIALVDIGWGIYISIKNFRNQKLKEQLLLYGIVCIAVFAAMDIGLYRLYKITGNPQFNQVKCLTALGAFMLIISLLSSFVANMLENYFSKTERELLEKKVYSDVMTGLSNRLMLDKQMSEIDASYRDYVMVVFDLNNLKYANDTYGHSAGDALICCFAECLQTDIGPHGLVSRTGGDEFVAFLKDVDEKTTQELLQQMMKRIDNINLNQTLKVELSTAYGVASGSEEESVENVFKLADDRMYKMKQKMKRENPNLHIR